MSEYLTVAQARERLRERGVDVPLTGMYDLIKKGRLPHVRLNRLYITDLDAFLAQQAERSTQPQTPIAVPPAATPAVKVPPAAALQLPAKRRFGTPLRDVRSA